jgi:hypothetical protein
MDDGATFDKLMAFTDVQRTVTCGEDSDTPRLCKNLWIDWQVEVLVGVGGAPLDSAGLDVTRRHRAGAHVGPSDPVDGRTAGDGRRSDRGPSFCSERSAAAHGCGHGRSGRLRARLDRGDKPLEPHARRAGLWSAVRVRTHAATPAKIGEVGRGGHSSASGLTTWSAAVAGQEVERTT